jgi:hypothetical protein
MPSHQIYSGRNSWNWDSGSVPTVWGKILKYLLSRGPNPGPLRTRQGLCLCATAVDDFNCSGQKYMERLSYIDCMYSNKNLVVRIIVAGVWVSNLTVVFCPRTHRLRPKKLHSGVVVPSAPNRVSTKSPLAPNVTSIN